MNSSIQIVEATATRLVIVDPPYYLLAVPFLGLGLLFLLAALVIFAVTRAGVVLVVLGIFGVPFTAVGVFFWSSNTVVLSRDTNLLTTESTRVMLPTARAAVPLEDIREVLVESGRYGRRLAVLRHSGELVPLATAFTTQGGHYQAKVAIERFLQLTGPVPPRLRPRPL